jgi:hypothetical protein
MENIDGCSICLEQDNQFQKWNCQHRFHENCANLWSNGCPICRTMELVNEEHVTVTWSISRNPGNVLDLERMKNTNILHENVEHIYKNIWKDRDCVQLDHKIWYFDNFGVQAICENCNTFQCFNRMH